MEGKEAGHQNQRDKSKIFWAEDNQRKGWYAKRERQCDIYKWTRWRVKIIKKLPQRTAAITKTKRKHEKTLKDTLAQ